MRIETYTIGIEVDTKSVSKALKGVDNQVSNISTKTNIDLDTKQARTNLKRLGQEAENVGRMIGNSLKIASVAIFGLGLFASKAAADQEKLFVSLTTSFDGSEEAADKAFNSIKNFAAKTPFSVAEVTSAFIKLKNLGLDPSEGALESYGNTASAMGKSLDQFIEAVADASVGEFERLKEFGIKAKSEGDKVSFTFRGVTTTVGKNAQEIEAFLRKIGKTEFAGGIEAQSKTFLGVISTVKDSLNVMATDIGKIINDALLPLIQKIPELTQKFTGLGTETKKNIVIIGAIVAALAPLGIVVGTLIKVFSPFLTIIRLLAPVMFAIGRGALLLLRFNPIVAIVSTLAIVVLDLWKAFNGGDSVLKNIFNWFNNKFPNVVSTVKAVFDNIKQIVLNAFKVITDTFNNIVNLPTKALDAVSGFFGKGVDAVKGIFKVNDVNQSAVKAAPEKTKSATQVNIGAINTNQTGITDFLSARDGAQEGVALGLDAALAGIS